MNLTNEITMKLVTYVHNLEDENKKLKECLQIAWETIDVLAPDGFVGIIELPSKKVYNHIATRQLAFKN